MKTFTNWNQIPVIIDLALACVILGRNYECLKKDAQKGKFPAFKNGDRKWSVSKDDLMSWIDRQKTNPSNQSTSEAKPNEKTA